jgi:hypothetical protein
MNERDDELHRLAAELSDAVRTATDARTRFEHLYARRAGVEVAELDRAAEQLRRAERWQHDAEARLAANHQRRAALQQQRDAGVVGTEVGRES